MQEFKIVQICCIILSWKDPPFLDSSQSAVHCYMCDCQSLLSTDARVSPDWQEVRQWKFVSGCHLVIGTCSGKPRES